MTLQMSDTIVDRIERVKRSIGNEVEPSAVQVAVDGPCPTPICDARIVTNVRSDSRTVTCSSCGRTFPI